MNALPDFAVIIRFKNNSATLPAVLAALRSQTAQPSLILGVDSGSLDGSPEILRDAGAKVVRWAGPYHHARVLNFAAAHCRQPFVLVLSSHTVLHAPETVGRMLAAMSVPGTACVSGKWTGQDDYSDAITMGELRAKGLRFCSIYSNSFGMFRLSCWEEAPFDERIVTMEDFAWALEQARRGRTIRRLAFPFSYERNGGARDFTFASVTFRLAARHGLKVGWLGWKATLAACMRALVGKTTATPLATHLARLRAAMSWRLGEPGAER